MTFKSIKLITIIITTYILIFSTIISAAAAVSSTDIQQTNNNSQAWKNRPRQFRMQVFSRPNSKGAVQTIRSAAGVSSPCWNLASKRVGSYELNDPLVKVTFYRSSDCHGAPSATFYKQNSLKQSHILIKAKSVSITKVKPIVLKDQHRSKRGL